MKVLLVNGSPHEKGCTYTALNEVAATFDQLNKYFTLMEMPIISSQYWNMVHGQTPEDVKKDIEGLQIMRTLGRNMAFFLKCKEARIKAGVAFPEREKTIFTNFIR